MYEPTPAVSFDFNMGHLVSDVEINHEALSTYLREEGFDDDTIRDTTIYVLSNDTSFTDENGKVLYTDGIYIAKTGVIGLYPYKVKYLFEKYASEMTDPAQIEELRQSMSEYWSVEYSRYLVHELAHKKRHPVTPENDSAQKMHARRSLGTAALSHMDYINDPEEAECEEAAQNGPTDLIRFEIKRDID